MVRIVTSACLFTLFVSLCVGSASAAVDPCSLPVDPNAKYLNNSSACGMVCSDGGTGTFSQPYCTLATALAGVPTSGTLKILPGAYRTTAYLNRTSSINIIGLGDPASVVLTPARAIDESLFTSDGNGVYSASVSALGFGSSTNLAVLVLDQGKRLFDDPTLGCTYSATVSSGRLRLKLAGDPVPTGHNVEIVDNSLYASGFLRLWSSAGLNLDIENLTFRGLPTYGVYLQKVLNTLRMDHVTFEMGAGQQIAVYYGGGSVHLSNMLLGGAHNLSYWTTPGALFWQFNAANDGRPSTIIIESSRIYPHNSLGDFDLSVAGSSATVDGVEVYSAGYDHTGISVGPGGPGTLEVRNSVFASFDYTGNQHLPYACYFTDGREYQDAAHDFVYSDVGAQVHAVFKNNLIAYAMFAIQFQSPGAGSQISGYNNIFINDRPLILRNLTVGEWDYNLYYANNDPYGSDIISLPSGSFSTLSAARNAWLSDFGCAACDSHSRQAAPQLVDWDRDDMLVYNFRPLPGSNVCSGGKDGSYVGPYSCDTLAPSAPSGLNMN